MRALESCRRAPLRLAVFGAAAFVVAGCSSDTSRFGDSPFSSPFASRSAPASEVTGSAQPTPSRQVETRALPPPPGKSAGAAGQPEWNWDGGTAITVAPGDTVSSIAHKYGVPVAAVMQANHIAAGATIQPGQHLVIPRRNPRPGTQVASPGAKPASGVHVVAPGESLISIARLYHKPRAAIAKANSLAPDATIRVGQRLVIPGAKPVPPAAIAGRPAGPQAVTDKGPVRPPAPDKVAANDPPAKAHMTTPTDPSIESESGVTGEPASGTPSFRWPVRGRIIAGFGPRSGGSQNDGINLAVPEGTSVKAAEDGVVAYAGSELKGYGNLVLLRHNNGYVTAYAHASELLVKRGDQVKRGQTIARAGQTGTVSAPQLHFEIRKGKVPVDPTQFLPST
ncbi:MAG TPA: peptidoglycan DD-metalloendopeptidase family protein [Xanthobacteraceae bacterium]|nr:peptidoglycan DD-metalloendopeptidase family protein [Xanthobacteraceae bacterium]